MVVQLELFRAIADENERCQQLGSLAAYTYPQSLGEWLGTAVQLAGSAGWQAHWALRPLATQGERECRIAEQGAWVRRAVWSGAGWGARGLR